MRCHEFLERYTDFRDGLITAPCDLRRFERHLARCPVCRRYDRALRQGVLALQAAALIEPSPDFRRRLEARLRQERRRGRGSPQVPVRAGVAGVAAALFVAAALALVALEVGSRPEEAGAVTLPPVHFPKPVAHASLHRDSLQDQRQTVVAGHPNPIVTLLAA